jgi:hypothetical protein
MEALELKETGGGGVRVFSTYIYFVSIFNHLFNPFGCPNSRAVFCYSQTLFWKHLVMQKLSEITTQGKNLSS